MKKSVWSLISNIVLLLISTSAVTAFFILTAGGEINTYVLKTIFVAAAIINFVGMYANGFTEIAVFRCTAFFAHIKTSFLIFGLSPVNTICKTGNCVLYIFIADRKTI